MKIKTLQLLDTKLKLNQFLKNLYYDEFIIFYFNFILFL